MSERQAGGAEPEAPQDLERGLASALAALRRKERTTAELAAWLEARSFTCEIVDAVLARLASAGALDDERYAHRYAEDKRELSGWGPERIREALLARGVSPDLVDVALTSDSQQEQIRRATELLARRARALETEADRARELSYLTRHGYDYEAAYEAVRARERDMGSAPSPYRASHSS